MSAAFLDKLLEEAFQSSKKKVINRKARKYVDNLGLHFISVSETDIYDLIVYNYVAIKMPKLLNAEQTKLQEVSEDFINKAAAAESLINKETELATRLRKEATQVASLVFKQFTNEYNKKVPNLENQALNTGREIHIYQPKNNTKLIKATILKLIRNSSVDTIINNITRGKEGKLFSRRTQFHHLGPRTVGSEILVQLARLNVEERGSKAAVQVVQDMLASAEISWTKEDDIPKQVIRVAGRIGPNLKNYPGEESLDWKVLRPQLEAEFVKVLEQYGTKFATSEGSQPFDDRAGKYTANSFINKVIKAKNVTGKPFKVDKPKNAKVNRAPKRRKTVKPGAVSLTQPQVEMKRRKEVLGQNLLSLQVLINQKLPPQVKKNMVAPALVNRTGTFAESTRITDIQLTPKGFPSIGYTYQKNPYQVFELTAGKEPWATPDRDPRKIIDKSIREIAGELLVGRFFTRRV